jgi:hypothetical protein
MWCCLWKMELHIWSLGLRYEAMRWHVQRGRHLGPVTVGLVSGFLISVPHDDDEYTDRYTCTPEHNGFNLNDYCWVRPFLICSCSKDEARAQANH